MIQASSLTSARSLSLRALSSLWTLCDSLLNDKVPGNKHATYLGKILPEEMQGSLSPCWRCEVSYRSLSNVEQKWSLWRAALPLYHLLRYYGNTKAT
jgi:hypothetical protein